MVVGVATSPIWSSLTGMGGMSAKADMVSYQPDSVDARLSESGMRK